jgi:DNA-binding HxlR family transcriptional regulator
MKKDTASALFELDCPGTCVPEPPAIARFHATIDAVAGKWKIEILCVLLDGARRFGELRRALPGITQHMLTAQLRDLEYSGLLTRTVYAQTPQRVEYGLTEAAHALLPVFRSLHAWAEHYGTKLMARRAQARPPRKNQRSPTSDLTTVNPVQGCSLRK